MRRRPPHHSLRRNLRNTANGQTGGVASVVVGRKLVLAVLTLVPVPVCLYCTM